MYPTYCKDSDEAKRVFALINAEEAARQRTNNPLKKVSVRVDKLGNRRLTGLSGKFDFELFSPHIEDMDCSNNCSIVLKLTGLRARGFSYLITGDTENPRWERINKLFGSVLKSRPRRAPSRLEKRDAPGVAGQYRPAHGLDQRRRGQPVRPPASAGPAGL
jgi:hypothetical protein